VFDEMRNLTEVSRSAMDSIVKLAKYLPEDSLGQMPRPLLANAMVVARELDINGGRAAALAALSAYADQPERRTILQEARQAANSTEPGPTRATALLAVADHLENEQRTCLAHEALREVHAIRKAMTLTANSAGADSIRYTTHLEEVFEQARTLENESWRVEMLMDVASYLPQSDKSSALREAVAAATHLEPRPYIPATLARASLGLPDAETAIFLKEALDSAERIASEHGRARELADLAPYLTEDLLLRAVEAAYGIRNTSDRVDALAGLAPNVAAKVQWHRLCAFWQDAFPSTQTRSRADLLAQLGALAPVLSAVGGVGAVVEAVSAVDDAARWWP
jgi:hypothetical protein